MRVSPNCESRLVEAKNQAKNTNVTKDESVVKAPVLLTLASNQRLGEIKLFGFDAGYSRERLDSYQGWLCEKWKCYLCAMPSPSHDVMLI